jgi:hypothetical protein
LSGVDACDRGLISLIDNLGSWASPDLWFKSDSYSVNICAIPPLPERREIRNQNSYQTQYSRSGDRSTILMIFFNNLKIII